MISLRRIVPQSVAIPGGIASLVVVLMLLIGFCHPVQAQTLLSTWTQKSSATSPAARDSHALAYDAAHGQVVLFGGYNGGFFNDTWLWNGSTWTQANPATVPPARASHTMVYDPVHGQVVMFGGYSNTTTRFGDTWLWDGTNWTQATPANSPPARDAAAMAYDAANSRVVLFGGYNLGGFTVNDTWLWDGTNWTQASPQTSPSTRIGSGMAWDAATNNVVLFGGQQSSAFYSDTWEWNGTNWNQQSPANSPPARTTPGLAYDTSLGQLVMFGGYNYSFLNDTWSFNGSTWIQSSPASSPPGRYQSAMAYDSALGQPVLFGGLDATNTLLSDTWQYGPPGNFGNINVCPAGQATPTPCNKTVTFTYFFANGATLATPQVVTQGGAGLDFRLNPLTSTCTGTVAPGTCTVSVSFLPLAPGARTGAINLTDNSGNLLASTLLYGVGQAPAAAFTSLTETPFNTGTYAFNRPQGLATDAAGNLYIADTGTHGDGSRVVLKVAPNGTQTAIGTGLAYPQGIAVDGAGDLLVADNDLNQVIKIPANCTSSSCQQVLPTPQCVLNTSGVCAQLGVAVDGPGNVFIASFNSEVLEIPANGSPQIVLYDPTGSKPVGIAVDAAGDLFITDVGLKTVVKIPAGCASASCQTLVGSGWSAPNDVAVDAAGDVFVTDGGLQEVVEVPAGCTIASCQILLASGFPTSAVTVDAAGDVFANNLSSNTIFEINRSQPPAADFGSTPVGHTITQSFTLQNIGNQPLTAQSPGLITVLGPNFINVPGTGTPVDCSSSSALAAGQTCNLSISFAPQTGGTILSTAVFSDNSLNAASAKQSIALSGTGVATNFPLTVTGIGSGFGTVTDNLGEINCSQSNEVSSGLCAGNYSGQVTLTATPNSTTVFLGWGGSCASAGTNPTCALTLSQASSVTASFVQDSFGGLNVCAAGSTAAGCVATLPFTFNLATTTTIGAIKVVTQGATGLDFALAPGSTCPGTLPISAGGSCNVNVTFAPTAPGLRMGAIQLYDNTANLVASSPVYGIGQEPEIAFGPVAQTVLPLTGLHYNVGVAVDATGNTFVADYSAGRVVKYSPTGVQTTVPFTGLSAPIGVAVDGAGDLYVVDLNLSYAVKLTPDGIQSTVGSGLAYPIGIALDGADDVFIGDQNNNRVVEITPSGAQTTVPTVGLNQPWGVAVDAQGDVFIADGNNSRVIEVTPAGVQTTVAATGLAQPYGVALDAAGDVYIADPGHARVVEVPGNGGSQITVGSGLNYPSGVTVDGAGNVVIGDQGAGQVFKVNRSQTPSLSFATTNAGSTSADSPKGFTIQNIGNQPLTGTLALNLAGGSFAQTASSVCSTSFPLAPGAMCGESFAFIPQSSTFFAGSATFSDNNLNSSPAASQTVSLTGTGAVGGVAALVAVPNVVGQAQAAAATPITSAGLAMGTVSTASSQTVPAGSIISQNPVAGTQVAVGSIVSLLVSTGLPQPPPPNPLSLENNYFLTGDFVSAGVSLRGTGVNGTATGTITIPNYTQSAALGVPDGADIVDAFLYWETVESTPTASSTNGTFNGYSIVGQQIGTDIANYKDSGQTGTIRAYRADVNLYLPVGANGVRFASGAYSVSLPDAGASNGLPLTEGASLVLIYRVLSPNFPLKSVVIYDGLAVPSTTGSQPMLGFYDAVGGANGTGKNSDIFASVSIWNTTLNSVTLGQSSQYNAPLNPAAAYAAVVLSTPVNNSDNDGILDAWKAGPAAGDFHAGQPGYYDAKTFSWVGLPGAQQGHKDLFVQMDYMCGAILASGACDPTKENLFPSPDVNGIDPLVLVQQAFAASGIQLHLQVGNAVPEDTCIDNLTVSPAQLCQFPNQPGVVGWKNSLEFSKLYPRNLLACLTGGDCTTRFPYGQKDSYHYVLFGHSLAIPAYNTRFGSLTSITVAKDVTTITTADRGPTGVNACPSRVTIAGVLGDPSLNGVYNTIQPCADSKTITIATPGVPSYTYPNATLPEPAIGVTFGQTTSISGYSDLGGADSAITLGPWLTYPNQDMSKRANVLAGTLFHEIGHTLGLSHGGLYYDTTNSYVPTFEANCKPNYQSIMNYLFQLDGVGPNQAVAFSNQTLQTLNETTAGSVAQLTDLSNKAATFPTTAWYVPYTTGSPVSAATRHCDGSPLTGDLIYRVDQPISPITPPWTNGEDLNGIGTVQTQERGFNDLSNMDLRQVGATGGQFASLATLLSFGSSVSPLNIGSGGTVALGSGGTVALGSGGTMTLGSGGNVTLGSGGTLTLGSGGNVTLGSGGNLTLGSDGIVAPGSSGTATLGSGGNVTLGSGGTFTLGSGGTLTLGSGGNVTLGSGGTIALGSGGTVTIPSSGGSYSIDSNGGTVTLGSGGTMTLGSGGNVTLGSGGTLALGSGGTFTLGSGGNVTLGSGGNVTLGSGGTLALGSGGNVTLGSGGTFTLGSGGTLTLGSGGNVTLGSGGTVTLGSGGNLALGSGGNVTLGSGGTATLGSGGTVTLGSGGTLTLGSGGTLTLGSGGNLTLGSGGTIALGSGGTVVFGSGGTITSSGGTTIVPSSGGTYTIPSGGGTLTLGSGGNVTLGSGGTVTLGSGGTLTLGSGGTCTLGSGGNVTLGSGGVVSLGTGGGGSVNLGSGSEVSLGSVSSITPGSGGPLSNELTYETANSVVRVPTSPTETSTPTTVRITWKAPAFGVVQTYTIYRSSNGATPIVIGSVSGVNGNPPATQFIDTNPDRVSQTVVYTITTTLVPDATNTSPRQSQQSAPAVVKNDQTITLGPLPSSVLISSPPIVTATALSAGVPNGLQVAFSSAGSCSIGSPSIVSGVSSAAIALTGTGNCTIVASQLGTTAFNAANSVSGSFMVLAAGSNTKSQMISFAQLPNAQYGGSFTLSASSSSGLPVSFTASGPCLPNGTITGIGLCSITASAPAMNGYSSASLTQSFTIYPAVLKVTATNLFSVYGKPLPTLTYSYSGFVNSETAAVVLGAPALSTTATGNSNAGSYPITVSTGTLATSNYSFLYVTGSLTIQPADQAALVLVTTSPLVYSQTETLGVTGGTTNGAVTYTISPGSSCSILGARLTATSGTGTCLVTATMAGNSNYNSVTSAPANAVILSPASQAITFTTNPPPAAAYTSTFIVAATGGASANPVVFTSAGACTNSGATFTMTTSVGTCSVIANQAGNSNYSAAASITKTVVASGPFVTVSTPTIDFGTVYAGGIAAQTITVTNSGTAPVTITDPIFSVVKGGNSNEFVAINLCPRPLAAGKNCTMLIGFIAGPYYTPQTAILQIMDNAPGNPQTVALSALVINPQASFNPTSLNFGTVKHAITSTLNVTISNPGATPLNVTGINITGANAGYFGQTNNCGSSLAAGASCSVAVKFTPAVVGTFTANLVVADNAQTGGGTQAVPLSGKGN